MDDHGLVDHGLFYFSFDGVSNKYSINPLEMTNFEATATFAAIAAVIITLLWDLWKRKKVSGLDLDKEIIYTPEKLKDYDEKK